MKFRQTKLSIKTEFIRIISVLTNMEKEYLLTFCLFTPVGFVDIQDVAVCKNELFCLHLNGKVSHLSLLSVERCVERLLRRGLWNLAARACCLFQNSIIASRVSRSAYVFTWVVRTSLACRSVLQGCWSLLALSV